MAVNIREKPKGSGVYWIFINHQGKRKSKKIGKNERLLTLFFIGTENIYHKIQPGIFLNVF